MDSKGKVAIAVALLFLAFSPPVAAREAHDRERKLMSIAVATYIRDPFYGTSNPNAFGGSTKIELGAVDIEGPYGHFALADWRSGDRKRWGQIGFVYECDSWNLGPITIGHRMTAKELLSMRLIDKVVAGRLIAGLAALDERRIAFVAPSQPAKGC